MLIAKSPLQLEGAIKSSEKHTLAHNEEYTQLKV